MPRRLTALAVLLSCLPTRAGEPERVSRFSDVVVAPAGEVYVADPGLGRVLCVSERWGPARTVATFEPGGLVRWPGRLALGANGALYVADPRAHRVVRVDVESGAVTPVAGTGRPGLDREGVAREVPLSHPCGLALRGTELWIADLGNRAVRVVDLEAGTIATAAGGWEATRTRTEEGRFSAAGRFLPSDLAFEPDGALLVLDLLSCEVLRLDLAAGTATPVGGSRNAREGDVPGSAGRVAGRRDFAVGPDGALWFADGPGGRVTRLAPGAAESEAVCARGLRWPAAVAVDAGGDVHVVDAGAALLARIGAEGALEPLHRGEQPPADGLGEPPLRTLRAEPDPAVVTDERVRAALRETGLPWCVEHVPTGIELVLVPPGAYTRGARRQADDPRGDARPPHEVRLTRPLYVGRTEVTNGQLRTLDPNHVGLLSPHHDLVEGLDGLSLDADEQPATGVCWFDARDFAARWGFRLPTEAEWEYFARAGGEGTYPWGDELEGARAHANLPGAGVAERVAIELRPVPWEDGFPLTAPVGSFEPDAFGLYDTIGNVWEWCADWYDPDEYRRCAEGVVDPLGPAEGTRRVLRGGSWQNPFPGSATASFRAQTRPDAHQVLSRGLRVVLEP